MHADDRSADRRHSQPGAGCAGGIYRAVTGTGRTATAGCSGTAVPSAGTVPHPDAYPDAITDCHTDYRHQYHRRCGTDGSPDRCADPPAYSSCNATAYSEAYAATYPAADCCPYSAADSRTVMLEAARVTTTTGRPLAVPTLKGVRT